MSPRLYRTLIALTGAALFHVTGCGSNASSPGGAASASFSCDNAQQIISAPCDPATRTCNGVVVPPDKDACNQCAQVSAQLGLNSNPLTPCACNKCAAELGNCFQSAALKQMGGDAARDAKCQAIVECALSTGCRGTDCYCGVGKPLTTCLGETGMDAAGPCAKQIEDAAGCGPQDRQCVAKAQLDATSAVERAYAVGVCVTGDPSTMAAGNCTM